MTQRPTRERLQKIREHVDYAVYQNDEVLQELLAEVDALEADNKELKLQHSAELIGQEHRLGSRIYELEANLTKTHLKIAEWDGDLDAALESVFNMTEQIKELVQERDRLKERIKELEEVWVPIPTYEGRYDVSNYGRVRSLMFINKNSTFKRKVPKILSQTKSREVGGYWKVALCKDNHIKHFGVHRLVLIAFVGPGPQRYHAAHLDGNSLNNKLENLKWVTQSENEHHKVLHRAALAADDEMEKHNA